MVHIDLASRHFPLAKLGTGAKWEAIVSAALYTVFLHRVTRCLAPLLTLRAWQVFKKSEPAAAAAPDRSTQLFKSFSISSLSNVECINPSLVCGPTDFHLYR